MTFGEKLFKLRKEKGLSQEALAEQLNTSRQAVSKWENNQGFPETEKLLMIGNIFEVSIDYLLKHTTEATYQEEKGYYVSQEMAEGYLAHEHKQAKYISAGIGLLILSTIPYLIFKESPTIYILFTIIIATLGIGTIVTGDMMEDTKYKVLKNEQLIFDQHYLKVLQEGYNNLRKKYMMLAIVGTCLLVAGGLPFLLSKKQLVEATIISNYYPGCVFFIAVGAYILVRIISVQEAYEILIRNEEYTNRLGFKLLRRVRKKVDEL